MARFMHCVMFFTLCCNTNEKTNDVRVQIYMNANKIRQTFFKMINLKIKQKLNKPFKITSEIFGFVSINN